MVSPLGPEPSASANSATSARFEVMPKSGIGSSFRRDPWRHHPIERDCTETRVTRARLSPGFGARGARGGVRQRILASRVGSGSKASLHTDGSHLTDAAPMLPSDLDPLTPTQR